MGNTPSGSLFRACRDGDVAAAQRHRAEGGDINYHEPSAKNRTPMIVAARFGHLSVVAWLLSEGAGDLYDDEGCSALQIAVKYGHASIAAVLLDKGCDFHHANNAGANAADVAGAANQRQCARLLEARACPFAWTGTLHVPGIFRDEWKERWLAVYRARPWDNPAIDRSRVLMYVYEGRQAAQADKVLLRPCLVHVARTAGAAGMVDVDIACESARGGAPNASAYAIAPLRFRLDNASFEWLNAVLHDSFASGRGAGFVPATGLVAQPPHFHAYAAQYATAAFAGLAPQQLPGGGGAPQAAYSSPSAPAAPAAFATGGGGGSAYPLQPQQPQQQQQQQQQPYVMPLAQGAGAAISSPPALAQTDFRAKPTYLHEGLAAMQKALAEGSLLPPGAPDPPEAFLCSITSVRGGGEQ